MTQSDKKPTIRQWVVLKAMEGGGVLSPIEISARAHEIARMVLAGELELPEGLSDEGDV